MLSEYVAAGLRQARYEWLAESCEYCGTLPACRGVWATGATVEECRAALAATLEDWVLFRVSQQMPLPGIDGTRLEVRREAVS